MVYIIGIIILLFAIIAISYFIKKSYYKEMDRLEAWKIELTERPVLDEMSKVKQLNMTGQTEELFERWRNQWDDIVTVKLPDLEDLLFDTEEYIDRYRFKKAKEAQLLIGKKLQETEKEINRILDELHELVGSEEKNRVEIEDLKEIYREAKKNLLAHYHSFGKSEKQFELQLNDINNKFQEYEEKTNNGNYLEAREIVLQIKNHLEEIKVRMNLLPQLLIECQSVLPSQLTEIRDGFQEMVQQGYYLEHIQVENECSELEEKVKQCLSLAESAQVGKAEEGMKEIKSRIEMMFELLEKEVHAKRFVIQNESLTNKLLQTVQSENDQLNDEMAQVSQSYHLAENEFETQNHLKMELSSLVKRYEIVCEQLKMNETAQTMLKDNILEIKNQLDVLREEQRQFFNRLQALRKDELDARNKINDLTKKINDAIRQVSKSNIPGLPEDYQYILKDGRESIENLKKQLEEKPLNINAVNQHLEIAVLTVEKLVNSTYEIIENVMLAEKVIQYGNRYRSHYPSVAKALAEAEKSFRNFDYKTALEQAATSIQTIDSGAIKKIETLVSKEEVYQ